MRSHSRLSNIKNFVLLISLVALVAAKQEDMLESDFIKNYLFCTPVETKSSYLEMTINEHYFRILRTRESTTAPNSFSDIATMAQTMLGEWQRSTEMQMNTFIKQFIDVGTYTQNFEEKRFNPMVSLVWAELEVLFMAHQKVRNSSSPRFVDWMNIDRSDKMILNEFSNLVDAQKSLIEEFARMDGSLLETWQETFPSMVGEFAPGSQDLFGTMKRETIRYLLLVYIAFVEHDNDDDFFTKDNVLNNFWRVFHPWINLAQCNRLVNGTFSRALNMINTIDSLETFLSTDKPQHNIEVIELIYKSTEVTEFSKLLPDATGLPAEFTFYKEENLTQIVEFTTEITVEERIMFDKLRIRNPNNCLDFLESIDSVIGIKHVFDHKEKFLVPTYYYYFIEYLVKKSQDTDEFENQVRAFRAVQIIYIFMNHILTQDHDVIKAGNPGSNLVHIIIRILIGLSAEGDFGSLISSGIMDEETINYIYMLLVIVTENNNLPKPSGQGELDRLREDSIIDEDDEDDFKINLNNPQYMYVVRRLFKLSSSKTTKSTKVVQRYLKKHFNDALLSNNPIFSHDATFFVLEQTMNLEFVHTNGNFAQSKAKYDKVKISYLTANVKNQQNLPVRSLATYFFNKVKELKTKKPPVGTKNPKQWQMTTYNEIYLGEFSKLKSNFMQMQYVEAILLGLKITGMKKMPDFEHLLSQKVVHDDRMNMFEFMKRVITNIKHSRTSGKKILVDSMDVSTGLYQDKSHVKNGERFHTLLLDITHFFKPELDRLKTTVGHSGARLEYGDINRTIEEINLQFGLMKTDAQDVEQRNFRMMMTWNIFDDLEAYLPLLGKFVQETKSQDPKGANTLKMEMIVESYTNLYIAILEHRLFAAKHNFSFETSHERVMNLMAYLKFIDGEYNAMFASPLPDMEMRFSKLDTRQIQNLIYFLTFRMRDMAVEGQLGVEEEKLTHQYYPYAFRETYALLDNHPEMKIVIDDECESLRKTFELEKIERDTDYTVSSFTDQQKADKSFKFCMMILFNKQMNSMIDNQAEYNSQEDIMLTITRESIFQEMVVPFYDKLDAHEMIIQVFNLNMSHAKAAARESAQKFSNYIALLDAFVAILEDLQDGRNDSFKVDNMSETDISLDLRDFCLTLQKSNVQADIQKNMVFIRHILLEKLVPSTVVKGSKAFKKIFTDYTTSPFQMTAVDHFMSRLRYGQLPEPNADKIGLNPTGEDIDTELVSLLMMNAPHREFTVTMLFASNFISKLPKYVRMAQDNINYLNQHFETATNMDDVLEIAYQRKMEIIGVVTKQVDEDALFALDDETEMDLEDMDLDFYQGDEDSANEFWTEHVVVTNSSSISSNADQIDQINRVLVEEVVERVKLSDSQSHLANQVMVIETDMQNDSEVNKSIAEFSEPLNKSEGIVFNNLEVVSDNMAYSENMMNSMDFVSVSSNNDTISVKVQDDNRSLGGEFAKQMSVTRTEQQVQSIAHLNICINTTGGADTQAKLKAIELATKRVAAKFNSAPYSVKVTSQGVDDSASLHDQIITHVDQVEKSFNVENSEMHISGQHDTSIHMVENGTMNPMSIDSVAFNTVLTEPSSANQHVKDLIAQNIAPIKQRASTMPERVSKKVLASKSNTRSSNKSAGFRRLV